MATRTCSLPDCSSPYRARGLCSKHWKQEHGTPTRYPIACQWCGAEHMSARRTGYACSQEHRAWVDSYTEGGPKSSSVPRGHAVRRIHIALTAKAGPSCRVFLRKCAVCASWFASPYTTHTCGEGCAETKFRDDRRDAKHRRRARQRDAFVANVVRRDVYKRDAYACMLCGEPLAMGEAVPHPLAPTIDHVVPLAKGGTHEPANVQAAHFICNSRKSDSML